MADKLFEDNEFCCKRFSCDCGHPTHIVDFSIELDEDKRQVEIDFGERYSGNGLPLLERIRIAFWFLLGRKDIWGHGFSLREEDVGEMIELLGKVEK